VLKTLGRGPGAGIIGEGAGNRAGVGENSGFSGRRIWPSGWRRQRTRQFRELWALKSKTLSGGEDQEEGIGYGDRYHRRKNWSCIEKSLR